MITPTKIALEHSGDRLVLRVFAPQCDTGSTVIENTKFITGRSLAGLRKQGMEYAKRFRITFEDQTSDGSYHITWNNKGRAVQVFVPNKSNDE